MASLITYVLDRWTKFEGSPSSAEIRHIHMTTTIGLTLPTMPIWSSSSRGAPFFGATIRHLKRLRRFGFDAAICLATALSYISEIKRLCDSRNIGLTSVLIPDEMQVNEPLQTRVIVATELAPTSFDFAFPNKLLRASFEKLKIDYIDLLTEFYDRSLNDRLYRPNDSHWNIAGKELAARLIFQHLSAQLRPVDK